jgi:hypothetical protein
MTKITMSVSCIYASDLHYISSLDLRLVSLKQNVLCLYFSLDRILFALYCNSVLSPSRVNHSQYWQCHLKVIKVISGPSPAELMTTSYCLTKVEVEVNLQPTVSRPVCLDVGLSSEAHDQIFFTSLMIAGFLL